MALLGVTVKVHREKNITLDHDNTNPIGLEINLLGTRNAQHGRRFNDQ